MDKKKKNLKDKVFVLGKQFQAVEKLGKGTYGSVYKAVRLGGEPVAIKKIKLDVESEGIPSTALREIAILKKMNHPNIVRILDLALTERNIELCLEYCHYDLKKFIDYYKDDSKVYNQNLIKFVMYQILKATDFLHSKKILHRDLKPQNILICDKTYVTKIADFGLSRVYSIPIRHYTKEVLTLWYRAPELMLGMNQYSTGLDMWSIGCIFGELYTKRPLFQGDSEVDQLFKIFQVFGTPNEAILPGIKKFPDYNDQFPVWEGKGLTRYVYEKCDSKMDREAYDLLEKMLAIDPIKRITAKEAMLHVRFLFYFSLSLMELLCEYIAITLELKLIIHSI